MMDERLRQLMFFKTDLAQLKIQEAIYFIGAGSPSRAQELLQAAARFTAEALAAYEKDKEKKKKEQGIPLPKCMYPYCKQQAQSLCPVCHSAVCKKHFDMAGNKCKKCPN